MYHSLVLPYFDYCSLVWNNCSQSLKDKIQRLQNRATRPITGDNYDIRSNYILHKLRWNNLQDRRTSQTLSYVKKALKKKCPEGINEMFQISSNDFHDLRSNNWMLSLSKPKTNSSRLMHGSNFCHAAALIRACTTVFRLFFRLVVWSAERKDGFCILSSFISI